MPSTRVTGFTAAALAIAVVCAGCEGGRDRLLADLQSSKPDERALAVRKLSEKAQPEDLVLFTQAARDPVAIVRAEAMTALGKSQDPRVVDILGEALGDPNEQVQAAAAMALAEIRNEKAKGYLTLQYGRRGRETRSVIVQALKAANVPGAMASAVAMEAQHTWERNLQALTEGMLSERVGAAESIGKSGRPEAVNRLVPLLKDNQVVLAAAAARGLGYAGDKRAVGPIAELLKENFPELREAACEALNRLQDASALPRLQEAAVDRSSASAEATRAIIALPRGDDTDAALCSVAVSSASDEALLAARVMRARGGCPLEPIAEKLRQASSAPAALVALRGLGPTAKAAAPKVAALLSWQDTSVRLLAVEALTALGDASAAEAIAKLVDQEIKSLEDVRQDWIPELPKQFGAQFGPNLVAAEGDPAARERAAKLVELMARVKALNEAKAREAGRAGPPPLPPLDLIDDAAIDRLRLLAAGLEALGALEAPGARELLERFVKDPSHALRAHALAGLAHLGAQGVAQAKVGLADPVREVQGIVADALARHPEGQKEIGEALLLVGVDRMSLLESLDREGPRGIAPEALMAVVREGGPDAGLAANLLGRLNAKRAVAPLVAYLSDPGAVARRDVLWVLGALKDVSAAETIARDLYHDSPDVRAAAAEALGQVGGAAFAEPLDALKSDYYRKVREAASEALSRMASVSPEAPK